MREHPTNRKWIPYLILPAREKALPPVYARFPEDALAAACEPCEGVFRYLDEHTAESCAGDIIRVERAR